MANSYHDKNSRHDKKIVFKFGKYIYHRYIYIPKPPRERETDKERDRETETERDGERETETDRQTDRESQMDD